MNRFRKPLLPLIFLVLLIFWATACDSETRKGESTTLSAPQSNDDASSAERQLPTVYPTPTQLPQPTPTVTTTPQPTSMPATPVSFDQVVVDLNYSIPAIGLERQIQATVANQIEVTDLSTGESVIRKDQPGVLLELQQSLADLTLSDLPEDCSRCVQLEYELPLAEVSGSGWLEDVRLLASLENYTSAVMGSYFPEGTLVGLRRSADPFHAAHTIAVSDDGTLWVWLASESEVNAPTAVDLAGLGLTAILAEITDSSSLSDNYVSSCSRSPGRETLFIGGDMPLRINISCPELALPSTLVPLYQVLDGLTVDYLLEEVEDRPDPLLPLDSLLYYKREDDQQLTIFQDGQAVTIDAEGQAYTGTVTSTVTISLTTDFIDSGSFSQGAESLTEESSANIIVLRNDGGVFETSWSGGVEANMTELVDWLEEIMDRIVGQPTFPEPDLDTTLTPPATPES